MKQSRLFSSIPAGCYLPRTEVTTRVTDVVRSIRNTETVSPTSHFIFDLKFDSLLRKSLISALGEEFRVTVPKEVADTLVTVDSAVYFFANHPRAR